MNRYRNHGKNSHGLYWHAVDFLGIIENFKTVNHEFVQLLSLLFQRSILNFLNWTKESTNLGLYCRDEEKW